VNSIDVSLSGIDEPPWLEAYRSTCRDALDTFGAEDWEVSVLLCDNQTIRELNRRFRDEDSATDVLSFPQEEMGPGFGRYHGVVGDVAISLEYAGRWKHLIRLTVHGLLHLAGYDHDTPEDKADMDLLQESVVADISEDFSL
jgi:probable rRNA maturation factor